MSEELLLPQFTRSWREQCFERAGRERFDVLIIGGGITGAAVARHAACLGLRVALVEQGDFASGTSSRSSRLIHGGLRYLKQGQVGVVYRSARAQTELARLAPHLARHLNLLFPLYRKSFASRIGHYCGMFAYDALQPFGSKSRQAKLSAEQLLEKEPLLSSTCLRGGFVCREYLTHDARLVLETLLAAHEAGALALNYARVRELLLLFRGRVVGAVVSDSLTGHTVEISARVVVNAAGPWADSLLNGSAHARPRLRLSKGVHIILPRSRLPLSHAVIFFSQRDKRALVAIPEENFIIVGPTETEYVGAPGRAVPEREDVDYLLEALQDFFPQLDLEHADLIAARAGLRPLYDKKGRAAGEVSRAYHIEWQREGFLSVLGGKLTLHRHAAAMTAKHLTRELKIRESHKHARLLNRPLPGANWAGSSPMETKSLLLEMGVEEESINHLIRTYGSRALLFKELLATEPALARRITPALPHILAEAPFSIRHEWAVTPQDFFERRGDLALSLKAAGASVSHELTRFWQAPFEKRLRVPRAEEVLV